MSKKILITLIFTLSQSIHAMQAPEDLNIQLAKAAYKGKLEEVKRLVAQGADLNAITQIMPMPVDQSNLTMAQARELDIKARALTPLIWAIDGRHEDICKFLLDHGANPDKELNPYETTPLGWAAREKYDNPHLCSLLLRYGADIHKQMVIVPAAQKGNKKICEFLLKNGAGYEEYALAAAAKYGQLDICSFFIARGVDVNARLTKLGAGQTPFLVAIRYATECGHYWQGELLIQKLLSTFLAAGARVNDQDQNGNTSLMFAAESWYIPEKILLKAGADPRIRNNAGDTPLMIAARRRSNDPYKEETDLSIMITHASFNPVCTDAQIQTSKERIFAALQVFKRICPLMPKDLRKFLLQSDESLKQDVLSAGAFGIREYLAASVPFQTAALLIKKGKWDKNKAISVIKAHQYACIKPLMLEGLFCARENTPTMQSLLNPNTAEQIHDYFIHKIIEQRLGVEAVHDAIATGVARTVNKTVMHANATTCAVQ